MKLRALHLTNVRKFAAKRASIAGIGDGITVVSEANEFGKSTFFDAVHALFFEKFSSSAKHVKSLQPYSGGAVDIAADVQTGEGDFRVEKRFLSRKSAKITRLSDGLTVAQDDEAERWISTVLGTATDGPAGLLWVRQGQLGLEADSAKEKSLLMETRRDLLSSVAGEIDTMTGGRRMDRVMRSVADSLLEITTKTGRKTGAWKANSDALEQLEDSLAAITAQVQTLERALGDRKQAEAVAKRLDNPEAKARRDTAFQSAKTAMEAARVHATALKAAEQERDLAKLKADSAQADLDRFLKAIDTLQAMEKQTSDATTKARNATRDAAHLSDVLDDAKKRYAVAVEGVSLARKAIEGAKTQMAAREAKTRAAQLVELMQKAQAAQSERDTAHAVTKASRATPEWLHRSEEAHARVCELNATLEAHATTLSVTYVGDARISRNGKALMADQAIVIDAETRLDLPGLGQMTIHTKGAANDGAARLASAQGVLADSLAEAGAETIKDARAQGTARAKAASDAVLAQAILDTLAPDGIEALRTTKAETDLAATEAHADPLPTIADLEETLAKATELEAQERALFEAAQADHASARETATTFAAMAEAAKQALARAETDTGPRKSHDSRRAELLRQQAQLQDAFAQVLAEFQTVTNNAPDIATVAAELKRAEDTVNAAAQERTQVGERLAALSSEIRTLAGNGIEERREELIGELDVLRASEGRFAQRAAALGRLQAALEAERDAARDTYFGPVQEELKPLLSILHRDAALSFDSESLLPTGLMRDAAEETLDDLSGGTQEQIAILTRLAFARLFARQGRHMPIILDDALVYSDDDRIIQMFTALTRVAQDQQILVFSCRQLAFQDLGGARPSITVTDA